MVPISTGPCWYRVKPTYNIEPMLVPRGWSLLLAGTHVHWTLLVLSEAYLLYRAHAGPRCWLVPVSTGPCWYPEKPTCYIEPVLVPAAGWYPCPLVPAGDAVHEATGRGEGHTPLIVTTARLQARNVTMEIREMQQISSRRVHT